MIRDDHAADGDDDGDDDDGDRCFFLNHTVNPAINEMHGSQLALGRQALIVPPLPCPSLV